MWVATQHEYDSVAQTYNHKRKKYLDHTHAAVLFQLNQLTHDSTSILEIGSGTWLLANKIAQQYSQCKYTGIELSQSMLNQVCTNTLPDTYQFVQWDFLEYAWDQQFTVIVSASVLHFMDMESALRKIYSLLTPGWHVVLLDRCNDWLFKPIDRAISTFGSSESRAVSSVQMRRYCEEVWFEIRDHQTWWWKYWNLQSLVLKKPG
jgi:SAM-dependent methyltransferase